MANETLYGIANSKAVQTTFRIPVIYCKEAKDVITKINAEGGNVSENLARRINDVILNLKEQQIWNKLDFLFVYGRGTEFSASNRNGTLIDWKNPNSRKATVVNPYSGDFTSNGWKGNGSNFRLELNFDPSRGNNNFTQSLNSFGCYSATHVDETRVDMSAFGVGSVGNEILSIATNFQINGNNNNGTQRGITNMTNVGLMVNKRTGYKTWEFQKNGYDLYSQLEGGTHETDIPQPLKNVSFTEFCRVVAPGTYSQFSTKTHSYSFAGGGFDVFTLHNIIDQYYLTPLGISPTKRIIFNGNSFTSNSTYPKQCLVDLASYNYDILWRGISSQTINTLYLDAANTVFNKKKPFLAKDVLFFWELTNTMAGNSSNATTTYNDLLVYLRAARYHFPNAKIVVATMLPRNASQITNANRQNDANLNDTSTLNGNIRVNLVATGLCDAICDVASDPTMGVYSNGVAGVGEKNTTYYNVDEVHPTTAGYQYLATNYITPAISPYL